ncbi:hypothetical protein C1645_824114 [Glomus cerebriforme]|uniref:Uncharacterized protein n=1 Tax=Glomus cerebriforme TaxID=658196 RepID=A0A397T4E6_9GLOM|nr:hypothetical protein C1645_824114 [Glomus cerebriforme]
MEEEQPTEQPMKESPQQYTLDIATMNETWNKIFEQTITKLELLDEKLKFVDDKVGLVDNKIEHTFPLLEPLERAFLILALQIALDNMIIIDTPSKCNASLLATEIIAIMKQVVNGMERNIVLAVFVQVINSSLQSQVRYQENSCCLPPVKYTREDYHCDLTPIFEKYKCTIYGNNDSEGMHCQHWCSEENYRDYLNRFRARREEMKEYKPKYSNWLAYLANH